MLEHIVVQTEEESGFDRASAVADMRFSYITEVCETAVVKPHESKERLRSKRIDRILTGNIRESRPLSRLWELYSG